MRNNGNRKLTVGLFILAVLLFALCSCAAADEMHPLFQEFISDPRFAPGTPWPYELPPKISKHENIIGCCSYCGDFAKYCFNIDDPRGGPVYYNLNEVREGDIITFGDQYDGTGHWCICLARSGNNICVAESNYDEMVRVGWNYTILNAKQMSNEDRSFTAGYHLMSSATKTGWNQTNGKWYYKDSTGTYCRSNWYDLNGTWYYFQANGVMATGWVQDGGEWYFMDGNGCMKTGWIKYKGDWFYLHPSGAMAREWYYDNGIWYYFGNSGKMSTRWQLIGGNWFYFTDDGAMLTGWHQIGGIWYYFWDSGAMATGWFEAKPGVWYYFDADGAMAVGWKEIDGWWEMFSDSGRWLYTW